jgi:hypothetical protein
MERLIIMGFVALSMLAVPPIAPGAEVSPASESETRDTMDGLFAALTSVLPYSWSDQRFADPASRAAIRAALDTLAAGGKRLEAHGRSSDAGFVFLSRSLARDTEEIRERFASGRSDEARYLLHELTDNCIACHSRLPAERTFPRGADFVITSEVEALPVEERARLEIATRQFDRALLTLEALFRDPKASPGSLDLQGQIDEYLELALRVKSDPQRAAAALRILLARPDLSPALRTNLEAWVADLDALDATAAGARVARARKHIARAESRSRYPNDRLGLIHYVAASGLLNRESSSDTTGGPALAEVYYLQGLIESRIGRSFWLSETEFLLQTAIELDPSGPHAEDAYALLEEFTISGYSGSDGAHVPEDVQQRLDALRESINRR